VSKLTERVRDISDRVDPGADDRFQAHDYERVEQLRRKRHGTIDAAKFGCEKGLPPGTADALALEAYQQDNKQQGALSAAELLKGIWR
jgi:hypothetical protein